MPVSVIRTKQEQEQHAVLLKTLPFDELSMLSDEEHITVAVLIAIDDVAGVQRFRHEAQLRLARNAGKRDGWDAALEKAGMCVRDHRQAGQTVTPIFQAIVALKGKCP